MLDPFAPATRRNSRERLAELSALEQPTPEMILSGLISLSDRGIDLARFEKMLNLTPERAAALYSGADLAQLGKETRVGMARARVAALREGVIATLVEFHRTQPQATGLEIETLHRALAPGLTADAFASLLRELAEARRIEVSGSSARLPGHNTTSNAADDKLWQALRPVLEGSGFTPPMMAELALQLKHQEAVVKDFLHRKAKSGDVMKVSAERFYLRSTLATLAAIAQATAQSSANGLFTAAQYRDATGTGRTLAIQILEFLDALGVTQRIGDARKMRKDFVPLLGPASVPENIPAKAPSPAKAAQPARRPPPRGYR